MSNEKNSFHERYKFRHYNLQMFETSHFRAFQKVIYVFIKSNPAIRNVIQKCQSMSFVECF